MFAHAQPLGATAPATWQDAWQRLHDVPPHKLAVYNRFGVPGTVQVMRQAAMGPRGEQHLGLQQWVRGLVRGVRQKDYVAEVATPYYYVCRFGRYVRDPLHQENVQDPVAFLKGGMSADCFTLDTKIIVRSKGTGFYELRTLGELRSTWPAYQALSYDFARTEFVFRNIVAWQDRGVREVWESHLGNGPSFRHTPDHRVWWWDRGTSGAYKGRISEDSLDRAFHLLGDTSKTSKRRVLVARKIPALGVTDLSESQAYLSGIYAAEGYVSGYKCEISQDKPEIRERIERALAECGVSFRPSKREKHAYYSLHSRRVDRTVRDWLVEHGTSSFDMQFLPEVLSGSEQAVRVALEAHGDGDAYRPKPGSNWAKRVSAIHATSSKDLADHLQLMCMIIGEPWHTQMQERHGGQGNSPIWRVHRFLEGGKVANRWVPELKDVGYSPMRGQAPWGEDHVADITVEGAGNFVLSNGMIAHNCDDMCTFVGACAMILGNPVRFVTAGFHSTPQPTFTHVFPEVFVHRNKCWVTLDAVAGPMTRQMLKSICWRRNYPLDPDMGQPETIKLK